MNTDELLNHYLTVDKCHFKKRTKDLPIELEVFYKILKWYLKLNTQSNLTIGDLSENYKQVGWIFIKDGNSVYRVNGDTKLKGLKVFYDNKDNTLATILNRRGKKNLISNNLNKTPIQGLYIYKDK